MAIKIDEDKNLIIVTFAGNIDKDEEGTTAKQVNNLVARKKVKNVIFHLHNCLSAEKNVVEILSACA